MPHRNYTVIELAKVESTNLYAEQLLSSQNVADRTVILALEQWAGKGQGENSWESEPGKNLTFSLILFPDYLHPDGQFQLNKAITLGILDFLDGCSPGLDLSVKWPNDIYAGNRKIGGILMANVISGNRFTTSIAGIGININQEIFSSGLPNPVSLKMITGTGYLLKDMLEAVLKCIDLRCQQLESCDFSLLDLDYCRHLKGYGTWQDYLVDNTVKKGRILGVDETGKLLVESEEGSKRSFHHGEIGFLIPQK